MAWYSASVWLDRPHGFISVLGLGNHLIEIVHVNREKGTRMKTVLIVEDDLINARVFSKILTKRGGMDVKHTENVDEVMAIAESGAVDIILMDVSLSHSMYEGKPVDGIKITQILKANPKTAGLPIILVTAHAMEGDRENFLSQSGADGYISKPVVDHQEFVDQITALLPD